LSKQEIINIDSLCNEIIGRNHFFLTPFGERLLTYADFTASGRAVYFIESYILNLLKEYANSHTEDDYTGKTTTTLLHQAEKDIKRIFNASENCIIIPAGTGSTGGINKLLEILGVYLPSAVRKRMASIITKTDIPDSITKHDELNIINDRLNTNLPVVFIGPYEHHSNDIMWRENLAEVVEVDLTKDGCFDLEDLEKKVSDPKYNNRFKIGSFSAASNVTGIKSDVYEIAKILHKHGAIVCFDFAGSAPYVEINMNKDKESYFDAIALSPHKFLGGPGSSGLLLLNKALYDNNIAPTVAAGGTVDYVSSFGYDFTKDPESREKPGTPGIIQIIKAALAIKLKDEIGIETIESIEHNYLEKVFNRLKKNPNIEILGNKDPHKRIAIISFLIKQFDHPEKYLHPKFVTNLLNDLFGIQSRAGCSCAGPYGHRLLTINHEKSEQYRNVINKGYQGIKPGWTRVNFHYTIPEYELEFILDAIEFISKFGHLFISEYNFNILNGEWNHKRKIITESKVNLDMKTIIKSSFSKEKIIEESKRRDLYDKYLQEAKTLAASLQQDYLKEFSTFKDKTVENLRFFNFIES
jgi:selenocysteine lyase/cysteine desulfurase